MRTPVTNLGHRLESLGPGELPLHPVVGQTEVKKRWNSVSGEWLV
jgi:hypothetical protein